jgi:hypothetical protein
MKIFNETIIKFDEKVTLNFLNIESYSNNLLKLIEAEIVFIRNGDLSDEDLGDVKGKLKDWIGRKNDERAINGFIAEFICHLYLRYVNYEQYSLFKNLEENGPKKGFDGLYIFNDETWLVESKSTVNISKTHNSKISEAFKDIKIKLESSSQDRINDPWENAKNHIDNRNLKYNKPLTENVKKLSSDFINNRKHIIKDFNIIPCSTIYFKDSWKEIEVEKLKNKFQSEIKKFDANKLNILCTNKKSIDGFIKFINS